MTTEYSGSGDLGRTLELLWHGKGQPTRGPKPGLTLERIVVTAVELANREGLPALSMRRVATQLGVGTMTLYRYVPGKGELLDLMLDHVNGPGEDLQAHRGKDWRTSMEFVAQGSWALYTGNPWLLQVSQVRPVLGPKSMAGLEFALSALQDVPLTGQEKIGLLVALDAYIVGAARTHVLQQEAAAHTGLSDEEFWTAQVPYLERAMETGEYPHIAALPDDAFSMSGEDVMRYGLRSLLDGFQKLIESRES
ncbi:TetR/AcrR family transcriptional regulator [Streptomyces sp. WMMB 322]|uniref:TetR/AcrR family transcriptional regulator n=1 Tax=Streptomyces sp. WMMB 322 TaxID=1286821 RepID=UPI0006E25514|nr:TetR/AcrR family transcriptional regulator [Streptomyces sp. WMMB 322]SCK07351.1 transcriptional regulator, TetR family [Streptomyces sp. WMMB 322]